jgi:hypothetical protein
MDWFLNHLVMPNLAIVGGYRSPDNCTEILEGMCLVESQVQPDVGLSCHLCIAAFVEIQPHCSALDFEPGLGQLRGHAFELLGLDWSGERVVAQPGAHEEYLTAFPTFDTAGPADHEAEVARACHEEM